MTIPYLWGFFVVHRILLCRCESGEHIGMQNLFETSKINFYEKQSSNLSVYNSGFLRSLFYFPAISEFLIRSILNGLVFMQNKDKFCNRACLECGENIHSLSLNELRRHKMPM